MATDTECRDDLRLQQLHRWLTTQLRLPVDAVVPASADASFRRYFRVHLPDGGTRIAMDAPPDREDSQPFVRVARALAAIGVPVPVIEAADLTQGFLLLSDFGSTHLLASLRAGAAPTAAYAPAAAALRHMQLAGREQAQDLPAYDEALLRRELALFPDWFLGRHLQWSADSAVTGVLEATSRLLVASADEQPQVFVHRDYHSRNLMVLPDGGVGILDFQDAVRGAVTYDLVSLYKDCYVAWPREMVLDWVEEHRAALWRDGLPVGSAADFRRAFDWMGLQRHLKVLGIFARLWYRDAKAGYLADLPLVLRYVIDVCDEYGELAPLRSLLRDGVVPRFAAAQTAAGVS